MWRFWWKPSPQEPEPVDNFLDVAIPRGEEKIAEKAIRRDGDIIAKVMELTISWETVPEIWGEEETGRTFWGNHESMDERVYITPEILIQVPENLKASFTVMRTRLWWSEVVKIGEEYCVSLEVFQKLKAQSWIQNLWEKHFILYNPESQEEIYRWEWNDFCFVQWGMFKRLHEVLKFWFTWDVYLK